MEEGTAAFAESHFGLEEDLICMHRRQCLRKIRRDSVVGRKEMAGVATSINELLLCAQVASVSPAFWCSVFYHRGALYLLGTAGEYQDIVAYRSNDLGVTWSSPGDAQPQSPCSGSDHFHCHVLQEFKRC